MSSTANKAGVVVLIAAGVAGLVMGYKEAARRPEPMDQGDLARTAERITSLAAELQLLSELLLEDKVTHHFTRAHLEHLGEEVHDQEQNLDQPTPPGLEAQPLREIRKQLQDQVIEARRHMSETQGMSRIRDEAARIHDDSLAQTPPK